MNIVFNAATDTSAGVAMRAPREHTLSAPVAAGGSHTFTDGHFVAIQGRGALAQEYRLLETLVLNVRAAKEAGEILLFSSAWLRPEEVMKLLVEVADKFGIPLGDVLACTQFVFSSNLVRTALAVNQATAAGEQIRLVLLDDLGLCFEAMQDGDLLAGIQMLARGDLAAALGKIAGVSPALLEGYHRDAAWVRPVGVVATVMQPKVGDWRHAHVLTHLVTEDGAARKSACGTWAPYAAAALPTPDLVRGNR